MEKFLCWLINLIPDKIVLHDNVVWFAEKVSGDDDIAEKAYFRKGWSEYSKLISKISSVDQKFNPPAAPFISSN
jgi:hypothetical protein